MILRKLLLGFGFSALLASTVLAQGPATTQVTQNNRTSQCTSVQLIIGTGVGSPETCGTLGTGLSFAGTTLNATAALSTATTITGITSGDVLINNGGVLGGITTTGSGSAVLATSPSVSGLTVTGSLTATGLEALTNLASQSANTVVGNGTNSPASPTALAMPSCSTASSALQWTSGTGFACNSSITANAVPAANLTGSTLAAGVTASSLTSVGTLVGLTVSTSFTATGLVTLADLATQNTNTVLANATSGTASPTAFAMPSCSAAADALTWTTNTGFTCNTSITAGSMNANALTGTTIASNVVNSSLTQVGVLSSGGTTTGFTINIGTGGSTVAGVLALANGGTNSNLTASTGGMVYSGATGLAILAGTGTAGQCLLSGSFAAPTWGSCSGAAAVSSVSNTDTTLTISPNTGAVIASVNLTTGNNWTNFIKNSSALTIASASGATLDNLNYAAATTTISGNTNITTAKGFNLASFYAPTYSAASALTITNAATLYVDAAPAGTGAGPATITNAWAIKVGSGNVSFPGTANVLGTITSGTWNGGVIAGQYGGTGVANTGSTITVGGNVTYSGSFTFTGTLTANTAVTFPTAGTLATVSQVTLPLTNFGAI